MAIVHHYSSGSDPWRAHSPAHNARDNYYGVSAYPTLWVDGVASGHPGVSSFLTGQYNTRLAIDSPVSIEINANMTGSEISVDVTVTTAGEAVTGDTKLRVTLIDVELIDFWTAPNGQNDFHFDLVDMAPSATGMDCNIAANSSATFHTSFAWPVTLNGEQLALDNVKVVAYVQEEASKEVLNAEWVYPNESNVGIAADRTAALLNPGASKQFPLILSNLMGEADNFNIDVETNLPDGWSFQYTTPDGAQTGSSTINIAGNGTYGSVVTMTTGETPVEEGTVTFYVSSDSFPEVEYSITYYASVAGDIVIVNETLVPDNIAYITDAMATVSAFEGYTTCMWNNTVYTLDELDLLAVDPFMIIWAGGNDGGIAEDNMDALEDYLGDGGNLWITGNAIADDLDGSGLLTDMGAAANGHYDVGDHITGVTDDPYFGEIDVDLFGGDGANNNSNPAVFTLFGGTDCLKLSRLNKTGVYRQTDTYNTVLFGFPFESIATADGRNAVMAGIAGVFMMESKVPGEPGNSDLPSNFVLDQNYPNPFNPTTTISFSLPVTSKITLQVFNVEGQEVKRLAEGEYSAGHHNVTFDASELASGVYIYRMTASGEASFNTSRKMLLVK